LRIRPAWWQSIRQALVQGTIISVVVAGAQTVVAIRVDDRRSVQERKDSREQVWRTLLIKDGEYPRAVLRDLDLSGIYAPGSSLVGADLSDADFSDAGLVEARLDGVRAERTDFGGAQLNEAVLAGAILTGSDFGGAQLEGADLREAVVGNANFSGAGLFHTDLRGVDLRQAGLVGTDTRYTCFDDTTSWPPGDTPKIAFCDADPTPEPLPARTLPDRCHSP
jgi:uncharacterized protein YjbI with pentapeptide repeats